MGPGATAAVGPAPRAVQSARAAQSAWAVRSGWAGKHGGAARRGAGGRGEHRTVPGPPRRRLVRAPGRGLGSGDPRPDQAIRQQRRGQRRGAARPARQRIRLPRAERRGQDHADPHPARADPRERRHDVAARDTRPGRAEQGAGRGRRDRGRAPVPSAPDRARQPAPAGRGAWRRRSQADRPVAGAVRAHRARRPQGRFVRDGQAPAARSGLLPARRPEAADPGRADERARPGRHAPDARNDREPGSRGPDRDAVVAPAGRGGAHLRRGRDRGPRPGDPPGPDRRAHPYRWRGIGAGGLRRPGPGRAAHRRGRDRRRDVADRRRADGRPARRGLARAGRRHQPAAGRRGDIRVRPPGDPGLAGGLVPVRNDPTGRGTVTSPAPAAEPLLSEERSPVPLDRTPITRRLGASMPTWPLIATKHLELRKRRGLMITVAVMTIGPAVLILGLRLAFHLFDPAHYGPAGDPDTFDAIVNLTAEFGFIIAAVVGAAAGTTDLNDGVFRYLVITGRSRLALYLARIPAGLAILIPAVAIAFSMVCLVTAYEGVPQPSTVSVGTGVSVPAQLDQAQLQTWVTAHPQQAAQAFAPSPVPGSGPGRPTAAQDIKGEITSYTAAEDAQLNPAAHEMFKIGLWLKLEVAIGFLVGLGLGSLTGQRTLSTILLIGLEIIVTPVLARVQIPYFLNGQRLDVGIAVGQLRPAALAPATGGGPGPGGLLFGGRGALDIPLMPTWAMISVIVGWIVVWSVIGAWRMMTRDA